MSIASELSALNGHIVSAYDEISTMGGTIPANKNMSNLPAAIASIPSGGGGASDNLESFLDGTLTSYENSNITAFRSGGYTFYHSSVKELSFPNLTSLGGAYTFESCEAQKISLPKLATIGYNYTFRNCTSLVTVYLPLLTTVGVQCFQGCSALGKIDLPSLTTIGQYAFRNCSSLVAVILRKNQVVSLTSGAFSGSPIVASSGTLGYVYVPASLVSSYEANSTWSTCRFRAIEDYSDDGTVDGDINV